MITTLVGAAAAVAGLLRSWPQVIRILRSKDTHGVSVVTWSLILSSCITWEAIGITQHIAVTIAFNVFGIAAAASVLFLAAKHGEFEFRRLAAVAMGTTLLNVVLWFTSGSTGIAILGVLLAMVAFVPQAINVFRQPTSGVSPFTWWLALMTQSLWSVYGVLIDKWVLIAPGFVMVPLAAVIVWRLAVNERAMVSAPPLLGVE